MSKLSTSIRCIACLYHEIRTNNFTHNVIQILLPVQRPSDYYVISFNIKSSTVHIIDTANQDLSLKEYGAEPIMLVIQNCACFSINCACSDMKCALTTTFCVLLFFQQKKMLNSYMCLRGQNNKAKSILVAPFEVLDITWRDPKITVDSGVYVMRHLETYMGTGAKGWRSGLQLGNNKNVLHNMRIKYLHVIVVSDLNGKRKDVLAAAKKKK